MLFPIFNLDFPVASKVIVSTCQRLAFFIAMPLFLSSSYFQVEKRVLTNMFLTTKRMLQQDPNIQVLRRVVSANLWTLILDRSWRLFMLLPTWVLIYIVKKLFDLKGANEIDKGLYEGKGAILFSCHVGPYYFIPALLALNGYEVNVVERLNHLESLLIEHHMKQINKVMGRNVLTSFSIYDGLILRKLKKKLDRGELVFIMGDYRALSSKVRPLSFLGYDINPGIGAAWLAKMTGAPLLPVLFDTVRGSRYEFRAHNQLPVSANSGLYTINKTMYSRIENYILTCPERWSLWVDYHLMLSQDLRKHVAESNTVTSTV